MNEEKPIRIPDMVDEMDHFLIWQVDEIMIIGIGLIVGILIESPMIGLIIGIVLKNRYTKAKDGKPRGYFLHRMRDLGLFPDSASKRNWKDELRHKFTNIGQKKTKNSAKNSYQPALVDRYIR